MVTSPACMLNDRMVMHRFPLLLFVFSSLAATYMDTFSSLVEGGAYILAAVLIVTAAYHAVAELRCASWRSYLLLVFLCFPQQV